jgi:Rod binding domain-containing protein
VKAESLQHTPPAGGQTRTQPLDEKTKSRLQKATTEFESIFVSYLLKGLRGSESKEGLFGENFGGDMMGSMFDAEVARHISRGSHFGIGEMLYKKITGERYPVPSQRIQQLAPTPAPAVTTGTTFMERLKDYDTFIERAAEDHAVDANLIRAVIAGESGGRANAHSSKNAKGLMQLIDSTAADMGVKRVWDPQENISGGAKYLKQLSDRFQGDLTLTLASYNAGPGAVEKYGGVPPFKETREYVKRVAGYLEQLKEKELSENADNQ